MTSLIVWVTTRKILLFFPYLITLWALMNYICFYELLNYCILYHSYSLHDEFSYEVIIVLKGFDWFPDFLQKKLEYFQNIFFHLNENKIVINFNCYFCFVQKLIWAIEIAFEIRQVHKRFIKLSITLLFWHKGLGFKFSLHLEGSSLLRLYFRF